MPCRKSCENPILSGCVAWQRKQYGGYVLKFFLIAVPDCFHLFFKGYNTCHFSENGGFYRCACFFSVLVQSGIQDTMIATSVHLPFNFFHTDVIERKQGSELAHRLEPVHFQQRFHYITDLFFQIALVAVHGGELPVFAFLLTFCRMQTVFLFQLFSDGFAARYSLLSLIFLPLLSTRRETIWICLRSMSSCLKIIYGCPPYPNFSIYSSPMAVSCSSVSTSSGCGLRER